MTAPVLPRPEDTEPGHEPDADPTAARASTNARIAEDAGHQGPAMAGPFQEKG